MDHVLGINCSGFHASACLLTPDGIHTAICEERVTRVKQDKRFPLAAIDYCLAAAGIPAERIGKVFVGWHPRFYLRQSDRSQVQALHHRGRLSYLALNELATLGREEITDLRETLYRGSHGTDIQFVDHHRAHLANAFYGSGFESADYLILDGFGETSTGQCGSVDLAGVRELASFRTPHSLGSLYSAFTDFLGFQPNRDEWKVMALAAQGDPNRDYDRVRKLVRLRGLGFELDLAFFEHFLFFTPRHFSPRFVEEFGTPLAPGEAPEPRHADLVAALQRVCEEVVFELLQRLSQRTGSHQLVVGGGFFMNSVCNGKLVEHSPYDEVWIGGSPDDSGIAVGSARHGAHRVLGWPAPAERIRHNFLGRAYGDAEIGAELDRRKLRAQTVEDPAAAAAERLRRGEIIGWFQGASEFGQRALGHRSILADPTREDAKDRVNRSVKYREAFRPFAPSVLRERQHELFEAADGSDVYFMEKVLRFKPEWRERVPAVVHHDGTGRLHSVDATVDPLFHRLVSKFEERSGVPVVLDTSFNTNGVPIVETPGDAIACFFDSGIDALLLGNRLLEK